MDRKPPTDAIQLLEENKAKNRIASYFAAFLILFVTFAIPATVTQIYRQESVSSTAASVTPTKTIQSFVTSTAPAPTGTFSQQTGPQGFDMRLIAIVAMILGSLVCVWGLLVALYIKSRKSYSS